MPQVHGLCLADAQQEHQLQLTAPSIGPTQGYEYGS